MREEVAGSHYWMTINSNTNANRKDPDSVKRLKAFNDGLKRLFLSHNIFNFIDINDANDAGHKLGDLFHQVKCEVATEIGPTMGYLHAHCQITITHYTSITLNHERIKKWFRKTYGLKVFIACWLKRDTSVGDVRYLIKSHQKRTTPIVSNSINFNGGQIVRYDKA